MWVLQYWRLHFTHRCVTGGLDWVLVLALWVGLGEEKWTHVHL